MTGRRFEAIHLFRRGLRIARDLGSAPLRVWLHNSVAVLLAQLQQWDRLREHLRELDAALEEIPEAARETAAGPTLWPRIQLALRDEDTARARELEPRLRASIESRSDGVGTVTLLTLEADLLEAEGRGKEALAALDRALAIEGTRPLDRLHVEALRIRQLDRVGRTDEALRAAEEIVTRMEDDREVLGSDELSIEVASELGDLLGAHARHRDVACRAYDLAAANALDRIARLEGDLGRTPELDRPPEEDEGILLDVRSTYRRAMSSILERVGALMKAMKPGEHPIIEEVLDEALVRICAWCGRVHSSAGRWSPIGAYVPEEGGVLVTHAMCESCLERVTADGL